MQKLSRLKPNLESTSKYDFSPDLGKKMVAFWACACKLSWTLFSPARVQPLHGAGRKEILGTQLWHPVHTTISKTWKWLVNIRTVGNLNWFRMSSRVYLREQRDFHATGVYKVLRFSKGGRGAWITNWVFAARARSYPVLEIAFREWEQ